MLSHNGTKDEQKGHDESPEVLGFESGITLSVGPNHPRGEINAASVATVQVYLQLYLTHLERSAAEHAGRSLFFGHNYFAPEYLTAVLGGRVAKLHAFLARHCSAENTPESYTPAITPLLQAPVSHHQVHEQVWVPDFDTGGAVRLGVQGTSIHYYEHTEYTARPRYTRSGKTPQMPPSTPIMHMTSLTSERGEPVEDIVILWLEKGVTVTMSSAGAVIKTAGNVEEIPVVLFWDRENAVQELLQEHSYVEGPDGVLHRMDHL